jgi:MFS family permease
MTAGSRQRRIARAYLALSALDYFADFMLSVTALLLLQERGFGSASIFAMIAAVWITEAVFEIPTGVIADMIGRRASVLLSLLLRAVGTGALFFSSRVEVAVAGMLLAAVGLTFWSGALEAWAVDESGEFGTGQLDRLFARARIAENAGLVSGTFAGAALGSASLALPQLAAGLICVAGLGLAGLWMTEDRNAVAADQAGRLGARLWASTREVASGARHTLRGDRILVALIGVSAVLLALRGIPGVQWTVFFERSAGAGLFVVAVMRSASSLLEIPVLAWVLRRQHSGDHLRRRLIVVAAWSGAGCLTVAALAPSPVVSVLAYIAYSLALGVTMPGIRAAINERLASRHRATALSVASLVNALMCGAGLVVVGGRVNDLASVAYTWPIAAAGIVLAGGVLGTLSGHARATPAAPELPGAGPPAVVAPGAAGRRASTVAEASHAASP